MPSPSLSGTVRPPSALRLRRRVSGPARVPGELASIVQRLRAEGTASLAVLAHALMRTGVRTPRGLRRWMPADVRRLLETMRSLA